MTNRKLPLWATSEKCFSHKSAMSYFPGNVVLCFPSGLLTSLSVWCIKVYIVLNSPQLWLLKVANTRMLPWSFVTQGSIFESEAVFFSSLLNKSSLYIVLVISTGKVRRSLVIHALHLYDMCFCSNQLAAPAVLIAHCSGDWQWFQFTGLHIAYEDTVEFFMITLWTIMSHPLKKLIFVWLSYLKPHDVKIYDSHWQLTSAFVIRMQFSANP